MIIILSLLFYLSPGSTTAIPLINTYGDILTRNTSTFSSGGTPACTCPNQRSIWDIIWSCLATIFACTWVSVHPNIPDQDERWWIIVARRVELVVWTLLTPEMVIYWAINQWRGARFIAREQKDKGWGSTHGYFMEMGGFMLYDGDKKMGILSYPRFKELLAKDRIEVPNITQEEIKDRSKSDGLSKVLVIGQTGWFVLQCITRRVENLPITELELATLALAALNGCMCFFWWNKPFDIRSPVPVKLRKHNSDKAIDACTDTSNDNKSLKEEVDKEEVTSQYEGSPITEDNQKSEELAQAPKNADLNAPKKRIPYQKTAWFRAVTIPWSALKVLTRRLISQGSNISVFNHSTWPETQVGPMRAPTFYSFGASLRKHSEINAVAMCIIGSIFGAIHCAGWFFHFPTVAELWIWRISSLYITVYPILALALYNVADILLHWKRSDSAILRVFHYTYDVVILVYIAFGSFFYIIARFLLLLECLTALRDLPPGAYDIVQWTIRIPHI